ncbi:aldehyde dehydrogenase [Rhodococcus sp. OK302]|uniref:aldehyde dehydrogenase n=1 Tax=Rhodococcus sp. OK302 TaxID=1882769 RepID=UPI000B93E9E8|nr:aldehyde dehydrogenase [Rhodococcus sp. OK302]OYD61461.1 acyl-CoA reductase-like NAD-dependent aldehyde dehydrogenase [Rhodococcus sp. OK302]
MSEPSHVREHFYIGGRWSQPSTSSKIDVISPATEQVIGSVPDAGPADIDAAVAAARTAFDHSDWPWLSLIDRAEKMRDLAKAMTDRVEDFAHTITAEMGSVISYSKAGQAPGPIMMLEYYADLAESVQLKTSRSGVAGEWALHKQPVGVVGAIVPWNGPIFLAMYKLAPALLAGCTVVLKPAPESPLSAYLLAEALDAAGFPPGVVNIVPGGREAGRHLVRHRDVDKIAFTGSTAAGRTIMVDAAQDLKRLSLELGGKSAAILLDDIDINSVLPDIIFGVCQNNGQICVSNSRLLVPRHRESEIVEAVAAAMAQQIVGDPFDESSMIGPLVAQRQRDRVLGAIDGAVSDGSTIATGGGRPADLEKGWYVQPTVIADVSADQSVAHDELFGPVLSVIPYDSDAQAIEIANNTIYGLGSAVFTPDIERAENMAMRIRAGTVNINAHITDFHTPFGGWKQSGFGHEGGPEALAEYQQTKVVGSYL